MLMKASVFTIQTELPDMANEAGQGKVLASTSPLRVLLIEDSPDDAELCLRVLRRAQPDIRADVVRTKEECADRIRTATYDVILADYYLGTWTGMDALSLFREEVRDVPFILVTGALGDQTAVECIKQGAADYILKDRLERLPIAIHRAIEEKSLRKARQIAEQSLAESEAKFRMMADAMPAAVFVEQDTQCCYV